VEVERWYGYIYAVRLNLGLRASAAVRLAVLGFALSKRTRFAAEGEVSRGVKGVRLVWANS